MNMLSLFPDEAAPAAAARGRVRRHSWDDACKRGLAVAARCERGEQASLWDAPGRAVLRFHSGCSAYWDLRGAMFARVPVGITLSEFSMASASRRFEAIVDYLRIGGDVFVDSGAFGAFSAQKHVDFEGEVFPLVDELLRQLRAAGVSATRLHLVAPDVVADADATSRLQQRSTRHLQDWMAAGARCIFPLHDPLSAAALDTIFDICGGFVPTLGIPTRGPAWPGRTLERFCARVQPQRLHLLGMGAKLGLVRTVELIGEVCGQVEISADSCTLLAHIGVGRRLTDRAQTRLESALDCVLHDPQSDLPWPTLAEYLLQVLDEPAVLCDDDVRRIARHFQIDEDGLVNEARLRGLQDTFGRLDPDEEWAVDELRELMERTIYGPALRKALSGPVRAYEVARLIAEREAE